LQFFSKTTKENACIEIFLTKNMEIYLPGERPSVSYSSSCVGKIKVVIFEEVEIFWGAQELMPFKRLGNQHTSLCKHYLTTLNISLS
jgi:hypothetical protein